MTVKFIRAVCKIEREVIREFQALYRIIYPGRIIKYACEVPLNLPDRKRNPD